MGERANRRALAAAKPSLLYPRNSHRPFGKLLSQHGELTADIFRLSTQEIVGNNCERGLEIDRGSRSSQISILVMLRSTHNIFLSVRKDFSLDAILELVIRGDSKASNATKGLGMLFSILHEPELRGKRKAGINPAEPAPIDRPALLPSPPFATTYYVAKENWQSFSLPLAILLVQGVEGSPFVRPPSPLAQYRATAPFPQDSLDHINTPGVIGSLSLECRGQHAFISPSGAGYTLRQGSLEALARFHEGEGARGASHP